MIPDKPTESILVVYSLPDPDEDARLTIDMRSWSNDRILMYQLDDESMLVEFLPGVPQDLGEFS
jgi:hypothetical protein